MVVANRCSRWCFSNMILYCINSWPTTVNILPLIQSYNLTLNYSWLIPELILKLIHNYTDLYTHIQNDNQHCISNTHDKHLSVSHRYILLCIISLRYFQSYLIILSDPSLIIPEPTLILGYKERVFTLYLHINITYTDVLYLHINNNIDR